MAKTFTLLTPPEFLEDVIDESTKAQHRIYAQAMEVEPGKYTDDLLRTLVQAAERGLDSRLHVDTYSLLLTEGVFNYWPFVSSDFRLHKRKRYRAKIAMAETLRKAGVKVLFTNPPTFLDTLFPVRGRNHMKIVIIDNISYIGGVNFHTGNFESQDVMIKITDAIITSEIAYVFQRIDKQESLRDMAISVSDTSQLLIDSGQINRSIILRHAVEAVKRAEKSVSVITPIIPDAAFLWALVKAQKRGITVHVITPHIERMVGIYALLDIFNDITMKVKGAKLPLHFKSYPIHAKIIIIDETVGIVGSHNYSSRGVRLGTEEIALESTDSSLVSQLQTFYTELTAK